jgi:hypothetical protein
MRDEIIEIIKEMYPDFDAEVLACVQVARSKIYSAQIESTWFNGSDAKTIVDQLMDSLKNGILSFYNSRQISLTVHNMARMFFSYGIKMHEDKHHGMIIYTDIFTEETHSRFYKLDTTYNFWRYVESKNNKHMDIKSFKELQTGKVVCLTEINYELNVPGLEYPLVTPDLEKVEFPINIISPDKICYGFMVNQTDTRIEYFQDTYYNDKFSRYYYTFTLSKKGTILRRNVDILEDVDWTDHVHEYRDYFKHPLNSEIHEYLEDKPVYQSDNLWISSIKIVYMKCGDKWIPTKGIHKNMLCKIFNELSLKEFEIYSNMNEIV